MRAVPRRLDRAVRCIADSVEDILARPETAIEQTSPVQVVDHGRIVSQVFGLAANRPVPDQPQPCQILDNGVLKGRLAAGRVDILDPEQKTSPDLAGGAPGGQGGKGVAAVQPAGR